MARGKAAYPCRAQPIPGDSAADGVGPGLAGRRWAETTNQNAELKEKLVGAAAVRTKAGGWRDSGSQLKAFPASPEASSLLLLRCGTTANS